MSYNRDLFFKYLNMHRVRVISLYFPRKFYRFIVLFGIDSIDIQSIIEGQDFLVEGHSLIKTLRGSKQTCS